MDDNKVIKVAMLGAGTVGGGVYKLLKMRQDEMRSKIGEDLELAEWLRGIENHGDAHALGFSRPEYAVLLDRKGQEAALKEKIKTLEEQYETADCI